ncbi:histidine phosphatase family protein [Rhodobacteraceae bacterium B1Z28]|uniref:Histidine phosphatase family protein n=1 Tax=Ruegeria haliotis TaxID=2747601 RepID=A0ABX2PX18_9RHOB|nr:histidine phosphatase family protein [Ruegeria haliotis]NVO58186.1 histidine phosphatase family protein [Ruegeria haliotis]
MSNYPDLFVLRHGETEWNTLGKFQGRKNSPLTETGKSQARKQNEILSRIPNQPSRVFVSPQERAQHTAKLAIAPHIETKPDARLMEIAFGQWEGVTRDYIRTQIDYPYEGHQWYFRSPKGESYEEICERVQSFLSEQDEPAIVVTHGVTSLVLRGIWLGLEMDQLLQLPRTQGCVFHLSQNTETILT